MNPNTALETAKAGAEATTKFSELMLRMFGGRFTKKQADADEYSDKKKLQLIRDNPDMVITYVDGLMSARQKTTAELAEAAQQRQLLNAIRQENNIQKVIQTTYEELKSETSVSDEEVDIDWITRFFDIIKDINNEELQFVWSKILAGEIKKPKSFSLRTLDIIRNLSQDDAMVFQKIIPIVVYSEGALFVLSEDELLNKHGVFFSDIMHLDECGLMNSDGMITLNPVVSKTKKTYLYNDSQAAFISGISEEEQKISFGVFTLTSAGSELFRILKSEACGEVVSEIAKHIAERNKKKTSIDVHRVNYITGQRINCADEVINHYGEDSSVSEETA